MELELHIRQAPVFNLDKSAQIYYSGSNPQNLVPVVGVLPVARQWDNYGKFINVTDYVSDLSELQITFTKQRDSNGNVSVENQIKKTASGQLSFEGEAYELLKSWLLDDVSASLNSVEVLIRDKQCGEYRDFVITSKELQWCEDGLCTFNVILKQKDELLSCIKRTIISDNWKGWFPENGTPTNPDGTIKKHPRFSYCNEQRPNGTMIGLWYIMTSLFGSVILTAVLPIILAINPILWILNAIESVLNAIPGVNVDWNIPKPIGLADLFKGMGAIMVESAGCGREHPAPLIRDYISNVCDKCGVTVNAQTAAIFFAPNITINTSTGVETGSNDYYNACYFNAPVRRGIRRFRNMSIITGFSNPNNEYWVNDNAPLLTLDKFLDQLSKHFNLDWFIKNGQLYIDRKDLMRLKPYVFDFRKGKPDRDNIIEGVCYEPTAEKYPASSIGIYTPDGGDSCGNEAGNINGTGQMNGAVNFVATDPNASNFKPVNPNFDGVLDKSSDFGATRFRFDGVSGDYIYDALQVVLNGGILDPITGVIIWDIVIDQVSNQISTYADYALLLQSETAINPKIIIWDGQSYEGAHALRPRAAWDGVANEPMPDINPKYNEKNEQWKVKHPPRTHVQGGNFSLQANTSGIYRVHNFWGIIIDERPAMLSNYPMYFEPNFKGTLWDRFHWIDDPNYSGKLNYSWSAKIELCCEDIERLGVKNSGNNVALEEVALLDIGNNQGVIKEITVSYKPDEQLGRYIELKGTI